MTEQLLLFFVALLANGLSAFAGGGAGLLQLPALIFLGLPFGVALATHKIATVALGIGATLRHFRERTLEARFALFVVACGLPGVVFGAAAILSVPDRLAETALGLLTISLGLYSFARPELGKLYVPQHRDPRGLAVGALVLALLGVLNGSLTSGSGLFVTLWLVRWFGLDYRRAVAYTLVLVGMFWNGTGAAVLGVLGTVRWDWVPALVLGSLLGGYLGAHLALARGNRWIKRVFELVAVLVGLKLVFG